MEIKNYLKAVNTYSNTTFEKSRATSEQVSSQHKNIDKVEFSTTRVTSTDALIASVSSKVKSPVSTDRITDLSVSIATGQYNIKGEAIAKSILD